MDLRLSFLGLRRGFLLTDKDDRSTLNALVSGSLTMARMAGSCAHIQGSTTQELVLHNASRSGPDFRVSRYIKGALPVVTPLVGLIPVAGPALSAVLGSGLEILKLFQQYRQNNEFIKDLVTHLSKLKDEVSKKPNACCEAIKILRDCLVKDLDVPVTKLNRLRDKLESKTRGILQSGYVKETIDECLKAMNKAIMSYVWGRLDHAEHELAKTKEAVQILQYKITGIFFTDATGCLHTINAWDMSSSEAILKIMKKLFKGESAEARIQRLCMEQDMYDMYIIEESGQVGRIVANEDLTDLEPGTRVMMRVIIEEVPTTDAQKYLCPFCRTWNNPGADVSRIECLGCDKMFMRAEADSNSTREKQKNKIDRDFMSDKEGMEKLRNFALKKLVRNVG